MQDIHNISQEIPVATPRHSTRALGLSIFTLVITIAVPILLILGSIRVIATEAYLQIEYHKADFPPDTYGFTLEDRLHYAPFALQYLFNDAGIDYLGNLTLPTGGSFYAPDELRHMADVKVVVRDAMLALAGIGITFVLLSLFLLRSPDGQRAWRRGLFSGSLLLLLILGGLLLYILLDWDNFFTRFHNLFFAEGSWTFAYSDSLIRLFPIRFWQDGALTVGGLSTIGALLILAGTWWDRRARG